VNDVGDFIVGYSRFGTTLHPAAGYSWHDHTDGLGTMRDPQIFKAGEDYYHQTFGKATGRNRWGDFTTAQVDPSDDHSLWVLQEYAESRTGTDDGGTVANGSRWSSFWAAITPAVLSVGDSPAAGFALERTWPQPTRGDAHIRFALPRSTPIRLTVSDVQGRETAVLAGGTWEAGVHEVTWRGAAVRPGLYFVRLVAPGRAFEQRLVRMN